MSLSPANLSQHNQLSHGANSTGPYTVSSSGPNYSSLPNTFSDSQILIPRKANAVAGTKSNCAAAAGKLIKYGGKNNISSKSNMNGGSRLSQKPCNNPANPRHNADPTSYDSGAVPRDLAVSKKLFGGKRKRHTMKRRKHKRKHKKHTKKHKRRRHKKHTKKHKRRRHKKHTKKHKRRSRHRRRMRGGKKQAFSNVPMSFGYGANLKHLTPKMSAVANPVPIKAYDNCGKVSRA